MDYCFGSGKRPTFSYILIQTLNNRVWVGKAVSFLRIKCNLATKGSPEKEFAFVRYMQKIPPENSIQKGVKIHRP